MEYTESLEGFYLKLKRGWFLNEITYVDVESDSVLSKSDSAGVN